MITEKLGTNKYSAAYSYMPIVLSSDSKNFKNFNYELNIIWNETQISEMDLITYGQDIYTKIKTTAPNKYSIGDDILIYDGQYSGYYNVFDVIDSDEFVIDLVLEEPYNSATTISKIANYVNYSQPADPDGLMKVDIMGQMKNFVSSSIEDSNLILSADSTVFGHKLVYGESYVSEFNFIDTFFVSGNTGFNNPLITGSTLGFEVGDTITVQMNAFTWEYYDNFFSSGNVGFTGSTAHEFETGDTITVIGQVTNPSYNGITTVIERPNDFSIITDKQFLLSSPAEGGYVIGNIPSSYNTTATITNVYIDPILGLCIETNIAYNRNATLSGKIFKQNSARVFDFETESDVKFAYDIRIDRLDYDNFGGYSTDIVEDNFIIKTGLTNFSTILIHNQENEYARVNYDTKAFLLGHQDDKAATLVMNYDFYSSVENLRSNTKLGTSTLDGNNLIQDAYYPVGIYQLINNPNLVNSFGWNLSTSFEQVKYYKVFGYKLSGGTQLTNEIIFKIDDCNAGLDLWNVMWKDSYGSFISFPFTQVARKRTDVIDSNMYKREGKYGNNFESFSLPNVNRGDTTYTTRSNDYINLESGFIKDHENRLFNDLINSPEIYVQEPNSKRLIPVTKETFQINYGEEFVDSIFSYSFLFKYAFNNYRF